MKPPTQRAKRGAQQVARHDMQRGVSSRARKRRQGLETVPDPRELTPPEIQPPTIRLLPEIMEYE